MEDLEFGASVSRYHPGFKATFGKSPRQLLAESPAFCVACSAVLKDVLGPGADLTDLTTWGAFFGGAPEGVRLLPGLIRLV